MVYTIFLTGQPNKQWRATVPGLPDCEVEAASRDEALEKIQKCILAVAAHTEVLRLDVPATPKIANGQASSNTDIPWQWFGVFQDEPTWQTLFDDIEHQRDANLIGE